jgi:hypothetical protein
MENLAHALLESAAAVAALGTSQGDIELLDDVSLTAGMRLVREHERCLQTYKLWLAASIASRSSHELGYSGLARRSGSATPAVFIQSLSGTSMADSQKLAQLGAMMNEPDASPLATAAADGRVSIDSADAIRRGLGVADDAVTETQLRAAAEQLIRGADGLTPEVLWRMARDRRNELDAAAIERGEKQRAQLRYVRRFRRDGMRGGSWLLPDEEGGVEIDEALRLMLASRTGGPRFASPDAGPDADADADADANAGAPAAIEDTRTNEQVLADGFVQVFRNGIGADPAVVPGAQRAAVRVVVSQKVIEERGGSAFLEASSTPIGFSRLESHLCDGSTVGVMFDDDGQCVNVGREQRLFTPRQRIGLSVRDAGCRFPGCEKPPSWTEAHHIDYWARDGGRTDVADGILLCRYHHMLVHNNHWTIRRRGGRYWMTPAASAAGSPGDTAPPGPPTPSAPSIEMPSKSPLIRASGP